MHNYEIEIKVLLGTREAKDTFMKAVEAKFPTCAHSYTESQKNHYFQRGNLSHLFGTFREYISPEEASSLHTLIEEAKSFSVRTRGTKDETIIVVKATMNDETSSNGTARIEWEVDLAPMSLDTMDALVLAAGFSYQAKWSREREGYILSSQTEQDLSSLITDTDELYRDDKSLVLCLDKNAGYGYLAEFERVITDAEKVDETRILLLALIESLGYQELDQARLARMFDFYNQNWMEYYGTENVFTIE